MNLLAKKTWELTENVEVTEVFSSLLSEFDLQSAPTIESKLQFYDDFDASLWKSDYLLFKPDQQTFQLYKNFEFIGEDKASKALKFWWQFPQGEIKDILEKKIGLRAITPQTNLKLKETALVLRNEDQKIVAKACLTQLITPAEIKQYLTLQPLRGYQKVYTKAAKIIQSHASKIIEDFGYKFMLLTIAPSELTPSKTTSAAIDEQMPSEQAVRQMANEMLMKSQIHVNGVIEDIDTEFLHQYRVSFRKLRSLISLMKKSLPLEMVETLKPQLSAIAGHTNKLRDLDVFLLDQHRYRAMLPEHFKLGLDQLYTLVKRQRSREKNRVAKYLASDEYQESINECNKHLNSEAIFQTAIAEKAVLPVVKKLLLKRYLKMLSLGSLVNHKTPDEEIHQLRIEFKKLRYLIEFFADLFPKKETRQVLSAVKKVQGVLGDFNDYSVQKIFLSHYLDKSKIDMSNALSGLIAVLHQKQLEQRLLSEEVLADFFTVSKTNQFNFLYGKTNSGESE